MSYQGRKLGGPKSNEDNVSEKVRKMKEKQKQWMQEREVAKVSRTKSSARPSSAAKQSGKNSVNSADRSSGLAWISKDDYMLSGKRSRGRTIPSHKTSNSDSEGRLMNSGGSLSGSSHAIKGGESERSRGSRRSETSIKGFDEGQLKSTRAANLNDSPISPVGYQTNDEQHNSRKSESDSFKDYSTNDLSAESFNVLADKIAERLQVKEQKQREINELSGDHKSGKPMSSHVCFGCNTLMAAPQHTPIAIIPCGHTFCQICVSDYSKCPQCQAEVFSTARNTVMQQIIEDFRKKQEKERLAQLEEQTRKYIDEYQNLNLRCEGLAGEADRILDSMESITESIIEEKRVVRKLEKENEEIKSKINELEIHLHQNEELIKESSSNCHTLEQNYNEEKDKLTLIEQTIKTIRNSKERAKIMIQNLAPNVKIDDSFQ